MEREERRKARSFIVNAKDLFDKAKNPHLSLSVKDILANPRIPKREIRDFNDR